MLKKEKIGFFRFLGMAIAALFFIASLGGFYDVISARIPDASLVLLALHLNFFFGYIFYKLSAPVRKKIMKYIESFY